MNSSMSGKNIADCPVEVELNFGLDTNFALFKWRRTCIKLNGLMRAVLRRASAVQYAAPGFCDACISGN